jgi:hypothetical protein
MPGSGEFTIGDGAPLVTRQGIEPSTFNGITVVGPPSGTESEIATQAIADVSFGTKLGLLDKCIGVQWSGKTWIFAAGTTSDPNSNFGTYVIAISKNPANKWNIVHPGNLNGGSSGEAYWAAIHGQVSTGPTTNDVIIVGGWTTVVVPTESGPSVSTQPALVVSSDGGKTFTSGGVPQLGPRPQVIEGTTVFGWGWITAVAYDKDTKKFYCNATYADQPNFGASDGQFSHHVYESTTGVGEWSEVGSVSFTGSQIGIGTIDPPGMPPIPFPGGNLLVNSFDGMDAAFIGPNTIRVVNNPTPNIEYCAVNVPGQQLTAKDSHGSSMTISMSGTSTTLEGGPSFGNSPNNGVDALSGTIGNSGGKIVIAAVGANGTMVGVPQVPIPGIPLDVAGIPWGISISGSESFIYGATISYS